MLRPGLLLDRDGVLNTERGYVCHPDDLHIHPEMAPLLRWAEAQGWPRVVITNQAGIAKGLYDEATLALIHQKLRDEFAKLGASFTEVLHCPHYPDISGRCWCRKPGSLLFERAVARHGLDPTRTWMLGDRQRDLLPARQLGIHTVHIGPPPADDDARFADAADFRFPDIATATRTLLEVVLPEC